MSVAFLSILWSTRRVLLLVIVAAMLVYGTRMAISSSTVFDSFDDKTNTALELHVSDVSPSGGWQIEWGAWVVKSGEAQELSKIKAMFSSDYRAVIDSGIVDQVVSANVKVGGGMQLHGVVANYTNTKNWLMWFYDGIGDVILGAPQPGSGFWELGRVAFDWRNGETHEITLATTATTLIASIDGVELVRRDNPTGQTGTSAGIFMRGGGSSRFLDFAVTGGRFVAFDVKDDDDKLDEADAPAAEDAFRDIDEPDADDVDEFEDDDSDADESGADEPDVDEPDVDEPDEDEPDENDSGSGNSSSG